MITTKITFEVDDAGRLALVRAAIIYLELLTDSQAAEALKHYREQEAQILERMAAAPAAAPEQSGVQVIDAGDGKPPAQVIRLKPLVMSSRLKEQGRRNYGTGRWCSL